ncbi:MAG: hypothetical protein K8R58_07165 [Bacteroidales bacterium]|nr:hypothetical protein [Bacteroidales bacterium]
MNKQYKNIDELFKDKFKDFELDPPDHIWKNIKENIPNKGNNFLSKGGITAISIIILTVSLFTFLLLTYTPENIQYAEKTAIENNTINKIPINIISDNNINIIDNDSFTIESFLKRHVKNPELSQNQNLFNISSNQINNHYDIDKDDQKNIKSKKANNIKTTKKAQIKQNIYNENYSSVPTDNTDINNTNNIDLALLSLNKNNYNKLSYPSITNSIYGPLNPILQLDNRNSNAFESAISSSSFITKPKFLFGIYFTPEIIFYPSDAVPNKRSLSFEINSIYQNSDYFIQSGLGVSFSNDDGNYTIDYEKYDYIGSYEDVYEITFDSTENGIIPIYHTTTVDVYDSIRHTSLSPTKNKYTYLQIPLFFGYCREFRRMTYSIKAGPSLSILIHEKIPDINYPYKDINVFNIDNKIPSRIKTHWQFLISVGLAYKLTNNVSLAIEPTMRYYMKSAYERSKITTKHPYSIGVRTGFIFNFN